MNEIVKSPNEILHQVSAQVKLPLTAEDRKLLDEMYSWLKEHNDTAVGLSAVQVGVLKRLCVIRHTMPSGKIANYKLANPKIIKHSVKQVHFPEGCLSVNEVIDAPVTRYEQVTVMGYDAIQNKSIIVEASGFLARIFQHEIDHMDGILFIDRIEK